MTAGLPPPSWPVVDKDGKVSQPWYSYLKDADGTWRVSLNAIAGSTANLLLSNNAINSFSATVGTTHLLEKPFPGCRSIFFEYSGTTEGNVLLINSVVYTSNNTGIRLLFTSTLASFKTVELVGLSTNEYAILSNPGSVVVSSV